MVCWGQITVNSAKYGANNYFTYFQLLCELWQIMNRYDFLWARRATFGKLSVNWNK